MTPGAFEIAAKWRRWWRGNTVVAIIVGAILLSALRLFILSVMVYAALEATGFWKYPAIAACLIMAAQYGCEHANIKPR